MLTRRSFLGTVAALAVSPVASKAAPFDHLKPIKFTAADEAMLRLAESRRRHLIEGTWEFVWPRRDDGDTILELR